MPVTDVFIFPTSPWFSSWMSGWLMSLSLIMAIGPQNTHIIRMGLLGQHLWLTVGICILTDVVLIAFGVLGLHQVGQLAPDIRWLLVGAGVVFLVVYGGQAARRSWQGWRHAQTTHHDLTMRPLTRHQAILSGLAFSWLNPHAWLDTAVLIGSASLAHAPLHVSFGVGAMSGAFMWFVGLGLMARWLGPRLRSPRVWNAIDAVVALLMWATAWQLLAAELPRV